MSKLAEYYSSLSKEELTSLMNEQINTFSKIFKLYIGYLLDKDETPFVFKTCIKMVFTLIKDEDLIDKVGKFFYKNKEKIKEKDRDFFVNYGFDRQKKDWIREGIPEALVNNFADGIRTCIKNADGESLLDFSETMLRCYATKLCIKQYI